MEQTGGNGSITVTLSVREEDHPLNQDYHNGCTPEDGHHHRPSMNPTKETGDGEDDQQCDNRTSAGFDGSTQNISPVDCISGGGDECGAGLMVGSSTIETEVMRENDSTIVQRSQNDEDDEIVRPPMSDDKKYFSLESRGASENRGGDDKLTRGRTDDCDNSTDDEFNTGTAVHEAVQPVGDARKYNASCGL